MFKRFTITAAVVLALMAPVAHAGLIFNFNWSSAGSSADPSGSSATATGTFTVDKAAGEEFREEDISAIDITVQDTGLGTFDYGLVDLAGLSSIVRGAITADGKSITFTTFSLVDENALDAFGCQFAGCNNGVVRITNNTSRAPQDYTFNPKEEALRSFVASAAAVPLPASLALIGLGLVGISFSRKRLSQATSVQNAVL